MTVRVQSFAKPPNLLSLSDVLWQFPMDLTELVCLSIYLSIYLSSIYFFFLFSLFFAYCDYFAHNEFVKRLNKNSCLATPATATRNASNKNHQAKTVPKEPLILGTFNSSTWEAEAGWTLSSKPSWSIE